MLILKIVSYINSCHAQLQFIMYAKEIYIGVLGTVHICYTI